MGSVLYTMMKIGWFLVAAAAAAALGGAYRFMPGQEEQMIIPVRHAHESIELRAGTPIQQQLILEPGTYSGVVLYAGAEELAGQPLRVTIRDREGNELTRGQYAKATYVPTDDTLLRLEVTTPRWQLPEAQHVLVEVTLQSGVLPLRAAGPPGDLYQFGELNIQGRDTSFDVALSLLTPRGLSFGARQGIVAGAILLLGLLLLELLVRGRARWWAAAVLVALLAPLALGGYWFSFDRLGIADWDYYFSLHHFYRSSLLELHTFPFWNPSTCGGTAGLADPEFPVFTPTFLLELIFGIPTGLRLAIYVSVVVGGWGMLALARRLGLTATAAWLPVLAVAFGTVNLLEVTEGHVNVFAAMWLPWVFWAWLAGYQANANGKTRHRWALLGGIFLALMFFQGGIYLLMYTGLVFAALFFLVPRHGRAAAVTVTAALWAAGFAAVKLGPVLAWLAQFPDESYQGSTYTLPWLTEILFGRNLHGAYVIPGQISGWHEYGAYVGYTILALALIGLSQWRRRRLVRILAIGAVLAVGLSALGPTLAPLFDQLWFFPRSNISRIILPGVMALSLLAAAGLDYLRRSWPRGLSAWLSGRQAAVLIVGLVAIDILSLSSQLSEQAFVLPEVYPAVAPAPPPIAYTPERYDAAGQGSRTTRTYAAARAGWGTLAYCSVLGPDPRVRTVYDEGGSALLSAPYEHVAYEVLAWSPNAVLLRASVPAAGDVTLNTNYADGWFVNGRPAKNISGLVGARVAAGTQVLSFDYRPPGFRSGLAVTAATIFLAVWLNRPRRHGLS
jgi:hypothetical protein